MKRLVFIALILVIAIPIAYFMVNQANTPALPFINPTDVQSEMVDSSVQDIGRNHKIGEFKLLDERNKAITDEVIEGKVFVAEFFLYLQKYLPYYESANATCSSSIRWEFNI